MVGLVEEVAVDHRRPIAGNATDADHHPAHGAVLAVVKPVVMDAQEGPRQGGVGVGMHVDLVVGIAPAAGPHQVVVHLIALAALPRARDGVAVDMEHIAGDVGRGAPVLHHHAIAQADLVLWWMWLWWMRAWR